MSLELVDARIKITQETDCVLDAIHIATGKDRSEIARAVLHEFALKHIHEANLLRQRLKSKGLTGNEGE